MLDRPYLSWLRPWRPTEEIKYSSLPITRTISSEESYDSFELASVGKGWISILTRRDNVSESANGLFQEQRRHFFVILTGALLAFGAVLAALLLSIHTIFYNHPSTCISNDAGWFIQSINATTHSKSVARPLRMLDSQRRMSQDCADRWISQGELCQDIISSHNLGDHQIDAVWTFVEPTSRWQKWEQAYSDEVSQDDQRGRSQKLFRSYDEIRYSLRSVIRNMPFARRLTLLATSMPCSQPPEDHSQFPSNSAGCQATQIPEWLNISQVDLVDENTSDPASKLSILPYWDVFAPYNPSEDSEDVWRSKVLPTFNR